MTKRALGRMILYLTLIILLLAPFAGAWAMPPVRWGFENAGTDPGLIDCGDFFIDGSFWLRVRGTDFFDEDGNLTRSNAHVQFRGELTNRDTGLTVRDDRTFTETFDPEGSTLRVAGLVWSLNVPGHGVIALDAGTVTFDLATGEILHEGGPHQVLHGLNVNESLCTAMAG